MKKAARKNENRDVKVWVAVEEMSQEEVRLTSDALSLWEQTEDRMIISMGRVENEKKEIYHVM